MAQLNFGFGQLNYIEKPNVQEGFDPDTTSGLDALKENASDRFTCNTLNNIGKLRGICLRVEEESTPAASWIQNIFGVGSDAPQKFSVRVRIPELHACIPEPFSKGKIDEGLIDMHPLFIPVAGADKPKEGDIVEVDFGNRDNQSDPVYINKTLDNPVGLNLVESSIAVFKRGGQHLSVNHPGSKSGYVPRSSTANYGHLVSPSCPAEPADETPWKIAGRAGDIHRPGSGLPCSTFASIWVQAQMGVMPTRSKQHDWKAWARADKWKTNQQSNLNVKPWKTAVSGQPTGVRSYDNIIYFQQKLGGSYRTWTPNETRSRTGPMLKSLTKNRWHIVQHWADRPRGGYPAGHVFMIFWDGGSKVRKVQDSVRLGFRDDMVPINKWWTSGTHSTVLTTPIGPKTEKECKRKEAATA